MVSLEKKSPKINTWMASQASAISLRVYIFFKRIKNKLKMWDYFSHLRKKKMPRSYFNPGKEVQK